MSPGRKRPERRRWRGSDDSDAVLGNIIALKGDMDVAVNTITTLAGDGEREPGIMRRIAAACGGISRVVAPE